MIWFLRTLVLLKNPQQTLSTLPMKAVFIDLFLLGLPVQSQQRGNPRVLAEFSSDLTKKRPLQMLKAKGFLVIVTANLPGADKQKFELVREALCNSMPIDHVLSCLCDVSENCKCQILLPGLFTEARFKLGVDLLQSFVIGDIWQTAKVARAVGATAILVDSPWLKKNSQEMTAPDLEHAVSRVLLTQAKLVMA